MIRNIFLFLFTFIVGVMGAHADSNGIWLLAEDVKAGVFASDEGGGEFTFVNDTYFGGELRDSDSSSFYIDMSERSQFNISVSDSLVSNSLEINGDGVVNGQLRILGVTQGLYSQVSSVGGYSGDFQGGNFRVVADGQIDISSMGNTALVSQQDLVLEGRDVYLRSNGGNVVIDLS